MTAIILRFFMYQTILGEGALGYSGFYVVRRCPVTQADQTLAVWRSATDSITETSLLQQIVSC